jgi:uncharacterized protein (DUF736 family)
MSKLIIGAFKLAKTGGWEGEIKTLAFNAKVRLAPNDDRVHPKAPDFRVLVGQSRIGDAWEARWGADGARIFYRVTLDDPLLAAPMTAAPHLDASSPSAARLSSRRSPAARPRARL